MRSYYWERRREAEKEARHFALEIINGEFPHHWADLLRGRVQWIADFWIEPEGMDKTMADCHKAEFRDAMIRGTVAVRDRLLELEGEDINDILDECRSAAREAVFAR